MGQWLEQFIIEMRNFSGKKCFTFFEALSAPSRLCDRLILGRLSKQGWTSCPGAWALDLDLESDQIAQPRLVLMKVSDSEMLKRFGKILVAQGDGEGKQCDSWQTTKMFRGSVTTDKTNVYCVKTPVSVYPGWCNFELVSHFYTAWLLVNSYRSYRR